MTTTGRSPARKRPTTRRGPLRGGALATGSSATLPALSASPARADGRWFWFGDRHNERIVREFWEAWSAKDEDAIMSYFRDDATYHHAACAPVEGIAAIRERVHGFLELFVTIDIKPRSIASQGDVVHTERIDRFHMVNGNMVALPVAGTLRLARGKIALWRDYFDLATFEAQSGVALS